MREVSAQLETDGSAVIATDGNVENVRFADLSSARKSVLSTVESLSSQHGEEHVLHITDPSGTHSLTVHPDGRKSMHTPAAAPVIEKVPSTPSPVSVPAPVMPASTVVDSLPSLSPVQELPALDEPTPAPKPVTASEPALPVSVSESPAPVASSFEPAAPVVPTAQVQEVQPARAATRRELRDASSFLTSSTAVQPATRGLRGALSRMGIRMAPSDEEKAERADIAMVSRHWAGTRTTMVANRKGGANKTPTVVNLAAVFARYGGGGVLAYDGNETMGTLGWRTEQGGHHSSVLDLLANTDALLSTDAVSGHMAQYVHHQPADKFDVLRSDENNAGDHVITADDVDAVHRVAGKYYRLILMDSGNSDRAENWRRMIDHTNQLVVSATTMEDRAEAALLTLRALETRSEHAAKLAANAVVIVSQWQPGESSISARIADGFRPYVREVVTVPFDPALKSGRIVHAALAPATRRAWLGAAAAVARGF